MVPHPNLAEECLPPIGMSDLATMPVADLLAVAKNYGVYARRDATGFIEVIAPPDASPIARAVTGRLRTRMAEIVAHFAPTHRPVRPCREAA